MVEREGAITRRRRRRRAAGRRPDEPAACWPSRPRATRRRRPWSTTTCEVRSSVVASQIDLHAAFGGVVPELASRAHVETITAVVDRALAEAGVTGPDLAAVAVTVGPGLVGALLVGSPPPRPWPSGGGSRWSASTTSRATWPASTWPTATCRSPRPRCWSRAGTACSPGPATRALRAAGRDGGRLHRRGLRQGGPVSRPRATRGAPSSIGWPPAATDVLGFPRPMLDEGYAFSFSGLKTAVVNYVRAHPDFVVERWRRRSWPRAWTS